MGRSPSVAGCPHHTSVQKEHTWLCRVTINCLFMRGDLLRCLSAKSRRGVLNPCQVSEQSMMCGRKPLQLLGVLSGQLSINNVCLGVQSSHRASVHEKVFLAVQTESVLVRRLCPEKVCLVAQRLLCRCHSGRWLMRPTSR